VIRIGDEKSQLFFKKKSVIECQFEVFIEPGRAEKIYWKDLWRYRELFYILSWRDLKFVISKRIIGVVWSVLRPLLTMMIFTFVFGQIAKFTAPPGVEYAVLVFAGLLPWQIFRSRIV
jgi:lipopolysaccharide transport system permease protein